ncbi:SRPBCC family protein [Inquilinus sp. KBS0705]|nr:SRPBCC family protein [Inquilinus sp. KBS0705]
MSIFEHTVTVSNTAEKVYAFLADMNNHKALMPDNITDWSSTYDEASFNIQNITKLSLKIDERVANDMIRIVPAEKAPFEMELKWVLLPEGTHTKVTFSINAELNMLMKMMASAPLKKLAEEETERLATLLNT